MLQKYFENLFEYLIRTNVFLVSVCLGVELFITHEYMWVHRRDIDFNFALLHSIHMLHRL